MRQKLKQHLYNIKTDICIEIYSIKQLFDAYRYTSSIQAKTFSIIKQLNGSMNGYRRYSIKKIVDNIMRLQELLIDKDGNSLSYYKIRKIKVFANYILSRNELVNDAFMISRTNQKQIKNIVNAIVDNLSVDNYLNELEIQNIINKHRVSIKYKRKNK